jgi:hypothetical protein
MHAESISTLAQSQAGGASTVPPETWEGGDVATDEIRNRIDELVGEEHKLWEAESRGEATEGDRRRLAELRLTLDQCWDLLRQRRALEEFGLDADAARARPPEIVERYEQ